jgi:hypothetical protein
MDYMLVDKEQPYVKNYRLIILGLSNQGSQTWVWRASIPKRRNIPWCLQK